MSAEHTTHHDDCGCQSAKYEAEIADLRRRLGEAEAARDALVNAMVAERDSARAEAARYHDALVARHGGEPVALLAELDEARAALAQAQAEAGAMRGAAEKVIADHEERERTYPGTQCQPNRMLVMDNLRKALSSSAGREMVERLRKLEAVINGFPSGSPLDTEEHRKVFAGRLSEWKTQARAALREEESKS